MKVLIIGANGRIGRQITQKLSKTDGFEPTAFIRKEEQKSYFYSINVPSVVNSLQNSTEEIGKDMKGFDAVVFTAGSGGSTGYDKTMEIDLYGAVKSIEAAKANKADRFVMISAAYSDEPQFWDKAEMKPYYIAKHLADKELTHSGLDYTILRPVRLTDDENEGQIQISTNPKDLNEEIPRKAVAETVVEVLKNNKTIGKKLELSSGTNTIHDAVQAL